MMCLKKFMQSQFQGDTGASIYNADETSVCVIMKSGKVLTPKVAKRVRARTGGERGENVTALVTVNATGTVILPPTLIFRGKTLDQDLMEGSPESTVFATSPKSFITEELFESYFDKFIERIPPARPVLYIADGHVSHVTMSVMRKARENDIHIVIFPSHTTHLFQPLDLTVFGPLKSNLRNECRKLIRKNKLKYLNRYHVCQVLRPAWMNSVTQANVVSGFSASGIWPLDRNRVILPVEEMLLEEPVPQGLQGSPFVQVDVQADVQAAVQSSSSEVQIAVQSSLSEVQAEVQAAVQSLSSEFQADVQASSPVVAVIRKFLAPVENKSRSKKVTKARIITSDEFYKEMEEKAKAKEQKEKEKANKREKRKAASEMKKNNKKKKSDDKKTSDEKKKSHKTQAKKKEKKFVTDSEDSSIDDPEEENIPPSRTERESVDNTPCGTCRKLFEDDFNGEAWIRCIGCDCWYHNKCQNERRRVSK